ncbi:hypothetical protein QYE76_014917 [Lolium multiflorum]|uniref:Uncharacterized protein n=1 Tax=Lolium multiflorum TaxID=4521 RepID=A0AAD8U5V7_LOLMU|nr:hypothetical protein QYE76_014917 [Lolium multiflorum]
MSRSPRAASVLLLLWLVALMFAFRGYQSSLTDRSSVFFPRKMLLAAESLYALTVGPPRHQHHPHSKWNWPETPTSAAGNGDLLYGAEKRRVPTGPNPLHH